MTESLAKPFEEARPHLRAVAYRMLGSLAEAEDAVQEAWLRLSRSDASDVANLRGWLTTVVARICLDTLRSRNVRPEEPLEEHAPVSTADPERDVVFADSISAALLVVLETLSPAERVAFVLHDLFDLPFEEIGPIVGRSTPAARQLASRARRRVQGAAPPSNADRDRKREIVDAFLAAARGGDFDALLSLLDPDVVLRADDAAVKTGASPEIRGAAEVAKTFSGRAAAAQPATIDGSPGLVWAVGGKPRVVFQFAIIDGKITGIDLIADAARLAAIDLSIR